MRRFAVACALAAALLASAMPTASFAQQDRDADLRCVLAFSVRISDAADDKTKQQATLGLIYFFGRLDGEAPGVDLQGQLQHLGETMSADEIKEALAPCANRLSERGKYLMTVGNNLQQKGQ